MNDLTAPKNKLQALREALREEMDAINTYDQLKEQIPEFESVFEEIKKDEYNHSGRLLELIMRLDGKTSLSSFNEGLEQRG